MDRRLTRLQIFEITSTGRFLSDLRSLGITGNTVPPQRKAAPAGALRTPHRGLDSHVRRDRTAIRGRAAGGGAPSGTVPGRGERSLAGLREHLDALRESQDLFARQVEIQRESEGYYRRSAEFLVQQRGWSEAVYDLIASRSKAVAAAETSFAAAVELRDATQRLIAELEEEDR